MQGIKKNDIFEVEITGYSADGGGICRIDGVVCFVKHGVRGMTAKVRIVKVLKNMLHGIIDEVITDSPHSCPGACPVWKQCGGCDFQHITYEEELNFKKERVGEALTRIGGLPQMEIPIVPAPKIQEYRNKAQYPVAFIDGTVQFGFFKERSHELVATSECLLQTKEANAVARAVCRWAELFNIPIYDEATESGMLRNIFVRSGDGGVSLCLVSAKKKVKYLSELIEICKEEVPSLCSVSLNLNGESTNKILGEKTIHLWGSHSLSDKLLGNEFNISPLSFYQVNKGQTENLYNKVLQLAALDNTMTAIDLYCGIGTITLALAKNAGKVWGIEIIQAAVENARENAWKNNVENVEFICNDAENGAQALIGQEVCADVVVCDPPRKGLDEGTIAGICTIAPKRLVYVSCDPSTMARDIKLLGEKGYEVKDVTAFDMFPRTVHVETCVLLSHKNS